ncbi:hypothetical nudix hydrolase YeaB [Vibrio maritimus]|uniref:Hypothetical nudix hydrolase YeaB n=1 Tax=Vibrio maritimus TaxID=990268 RepID=A0A090T5J9_9VIBR|nr:hypothetical nudix hydrolase YeaB [Vibrio maritimus]
MTKSEFLSRFQLQQTEDYHKETKFRTANIDKGSLREASVLIGLVEREAKLHVILTKRASHLKHHPGRLAFRVVRLSQAIKARPLQHFERQKKR